MASRPPTITAFTAHVVFPIVLGALVYVLFRTPHLLVFSWLDALGLTPQVLAARAALVGLTLPHWLLYSLPDGTWVYAATAATALIWHDQGGTRRWIWVSAGATIAIGSELAQLARGVPGVFDPVDLLAYVAAWLAALLIISRRWSA